MMPLDKALETIKDYVRTKDNDADIKEHKELALAHFELERHLVKDQNDQETIQDRDDRGR
jgi:hypothetical protein